MVNLMMTNKQTSNPNGDISSFRVIFDTQTQFKSKNEK